MGKFGILSCLIHCAKTHLTFGPSKVKHRLYMVPEKGLTDGAWFNVCVKV